MFLGMILLHHRVSIPGARGKMGLIPWECNKSTKGEECESGRRISTSASSELLIRLVFGCQSQRQYKKRQTVGTYLSPRACSSSESTILRILSNSFICVHASLSSHS